MPDAEFKVEVIPNQGAGAAAMLLDYIEGQGQVLGYYTNELRHRGYEKAPH